MYKKCDVEAALKQACLEILNDNTIFEGLDNDEDKLSIITSEFRNRALKNLENAHTYQVYSIDAKLGYEGTSFVAGLTAEDANRYIQCFQEIDRSEEKKSEGYNTISEEDVLEGVFCDTPGFLYHGIRKEK